MVSVIIPVYNTEAYCDQAIASVCRQTCQDLEIILVEDGSTDNSGEKCREWSKRDRRIRLFCQENSGLSEARNKGIREARGEYLFFLDSDDTLHPQTIEILLAGLQNHGCCLSLCSYREFHEDAELAETESIPNAEALSWQFFDSYTGLSALYDPALGMAFTLAWNKLYRRSLFEGVEFPQGKIIEDEGTSWKILAKCNKIGMVHYPFCNYRQRQGSIMKQDNMKQRMVVLDFQKERIEYFSRKFMEDEAYGQLVELAVRRYLYRIIWFYDVMPTEYRVGLKQRFDREWMRVRECRNVKVINRILFEGFQKWPEFTKYLVRLREKICK